MSPLLITIVGVSAAVITTSSWLPQVLLTWRTRRARDFSWTYLALFLTGTSLWLFYGLLRKDNAVIGANGVTWLLVISIGWVKWRDEMSSRT